MVPDFPLRGSSGPFSFRQVAHSPVAQPLGIHHIRAPGSYHTYTSLDFPVSLGKYDFPSKPEEPAVLFLLRTPCHPGLPVRDQNRAGRVELLQTPYAKFERNIRDQLGRMLSGAWIRPGSRYRRNHRKWVGASPSPIPTQARARTQTSRSIRPIAPSAKSSPSVPDISSFGILR
jgi:hypothetical protein